MNITSLEKRAAARAQTRNEKEAVTNLAVGYRQMMMIVAIAQKEGEARAVADFRHKAMRYLVGLRRIARGADVFRVYEWVTGSRPWDDR